MRKSSAVAVLVILAASAFDPTTALAKAPSAADFLWTFSSSDARNRSASQTAEESPEWVAGAKVGGDAAGAVVHDSRGRVMKKESFGASLPSFEQRYVGERPAFEPTIAFDRAGNVFFPSGDPADRTIVLYASRDNGRSWSDETPDNSYVGDPLVHFDPLTGRTYFAHLQGRPVGGPFIHWTDDGDFTWNDIDTIKKTVDKENLFTGRCVEAGALPCQSASTLYYCTYYVATNLCNASVDGGTTWTETKVTSGCSLITGLGAASNKEGTAYIPLVGCGEPRVAVSHDNGVSWNQITVSTAVGQAFDLGTRIAVDTEGNAYYAFTGDDWLPYLSVSRDQGRTWSSPLRVSPPGVTASRYANVAAGDAGKIVVTYLGTSAQGGMAAANEEASQATWSHFATFTLNGLAKSPTFASTTINPETDVIKRGPCYARCIAGSGSYQDTAGPFEYLDVEIHPITGRAWVPTVDMCLEECASGIIRDPEPSRGSVGIQLTGPRLGSATQGTTKQKERRQAAETAVRAVSNTDHRLQAARRLLEARTDPALLGGLALPNYEREDVTRQELNLKLAREAESIQDSSLNKRTRQTLDLREHRSAPCSEVDYVQKELMRMASVLDISVQEKDISFARFGSAEKRSLSCLFRRLTNLAASASGTSHTGATRMESRLLAAALLDFRKAHSSSAASLIVPPLFAIDTEGKDSTYKEDVILTIDMGGNDRYLNNAGGNNINGGDCLTPLSPVGALLDSGGNDTFGGTDPRVPSPERRGCGVAGGAFRGTSVLVDTGGNDRYIAGSQGSIGGASAGTALLIDAAGNDLYNGGSDGVNGGGSLAGSGQLFDLGGSDRYEAGAEGTNGGAWAGSGILVDSSGDDSYSGGAGGVNGGGFNGSGSLLDLAGKDEYLSDGLASNGGTNLGGTGFLYDASGSDRYGVTYGARAGMNGGSFYSGIGFLVDGGGDDIYAAGALAANGGGAIGVGILLDWAGEDTYSALEQGTNGGTWAGLGTLLDIGGDDDYVATAQGSNGGSYQAGVGLLADLGGKDNYRDALMNCTDCTQYPKEGPGGFQIDQQ